MGRDYTQLTLEDRCEMARLHTTGHSLRKLRQLWIARHRRWLGN